LSASDSATDKFNLKIALTIDTPTSTSHSTLSFKLKFLPLASPYFTFTHLPQPLSISHGVAVPPLSPSLSSPKPPPTILYLHGAGVSPITSVETVLAVPPQDLGIWIIHPLGRTEWGYDWHGASVRESKHAVMMMNWRKRWETLVGWREEDSDQVKEEGKLIVLGHSNGGQGCEYFLQRWPDEVIGGICAAG
jgi:pimeloyl-ACP methyl ester carboxylesterase